MGLKFKKKLAWFYKLFLHLSDGIVYVITFKGELHPHGLGRHAITLTANCIPLERLVIGHGNLSQFLMILHDLAPHALTTSGFNEST